MVDGEIAERAFVLKVTLRDIEPPVWRRFAVPWGITLPRLHAVLQIVMGWQNCHLYEFTIERQTYGLPDSPRAEGLLGEEGTPLWRLVGGAGAEFSYTYDYGDEWEHVIRVEKECGVRTFNRLPTCLDGARACPPEDCGGPWGYGELLEAIHDPQHERHDELRRWLAARGDEDFDAEAFAVTSVNGRLAHLR